ncbi:MAG: hypothetical protein IJH84_13430, partial [Saccharopolyspora sp.]|uniref:hypothetical protein n=1 Tax=Saccharopolyspora sp. TaxID=33915 RepID=UPI0025DEB85F
LPPDAVPQLRERTAMWSDLLGSLAGAPVAHLRDRSRELEALADQARGLRSAALSQEFTAARHAAQRHQSPLVFRRDGIPGGVSSRTDLKAGFEVEFQLPGRGFEARARKLVAQLRNLGFLGEQTDLLDAGSTRVGAAHEAGKSALVREESDLNTAELVTEIMRPGQNPGTWAKFADILGHVRAESGDAAITGGHINLSFDAQLTPQQYVRLAQLQKSFESLTYRLGNHPNGRRARVMDYVGPNPLPMNPAEVTSYSDLRMLNRGKHDAINFAHLEGTGSDRVEFRFWAGSLDPAEWQVRTEISAAMLAAAQDPSIYPRLNELMTDPGLLGMGGAELPELQNFLELLPMSPEAQRQAVRLLAWTEPWEGTSGSDFYGRANSVTMPSAGGVYLPYFEQPVPDVMRAVAGLPRFPNTDVVVAHPEDGDPSTFERWDGETLDGDELVDVITHRDVGNGKAVVLAIPGLLNEDSNAGYADPGAPNPFEADVEADWLDSLTFRTKAPIYVAANVVQTPDGRLLAGKNVPMPDGTLRFQPDPRGWVRFQQKTSASRGETDLARMLAADAPVIQQFVDAQPALVDPRDENSSSDGEYSDSDVDMDGRSDSGSESGAAAYEQVLTFEPQQPSTRPRRPRADSDDEMTDADTTDSHSDAEMTEVESVSTEVASDADSASAHSDAEMTEADARSDADSPDPDRTESDVESSSAESAGSSADSEAGPGWPDGVEPPVTDPAWRHTQVTSASWFDPKGPLDLDALDRTRRPMPDSTVETEDADLKMSGNARRADVLYGPVRYDFQRRKVGDDWVQEFTFKAHLESDEHLAHYLEEAEYHRAAADKRERAARDAEAAAGLLELSTPQGDPSVVEARNRADRAREEADRRSRQADEAEAELRHQRQRIDDLKDRAQRSMDSMFNQGYRMPHSGDLFHARLEFVDADQAHDSISLVEGDRMSQGTWSFDDPGTGYAHEVGHYFGLPDEYFERARFERGSRKYKGRQVPEYTVRTHLNTAPYLKPYANKAEAAEKRAVEAEEIADLDQDDVVRLTADLMDEDSVETPDEVLAAEQQERNSRAEAERLREEAELAKQGLRNETQRAEAIRDRAARGVADLFHPGRMKRDEPYFVKLEFVDSPRQAHHLVDLQHEEAFVPGKWSVEDPGGVIALKTGRHLQVPTTFMSGLRDGSLDDANVHPVDDRRVFNRMDRPAAYDHTTGLPHRMQNSYIDGTGWTGAPGDEFLPRHMWRIEEVARSQGLTPEVVVPGPTRQAWRLRYLLSKDHVSASEVLGALRELGGDRAKVDAVREAFGQETGRSLDAALHAALDDRGFERALHYLRSSEVFRAGPAHTTSGGGRPRMRPDTLDDAPEPSPEHDSEAGTTPHKQHPEPGAEDAPPLEQARSESEAAASETAQTENSEIGTAEPVAAAETSTPEAAAPAPLSTLEDFLSPSEPVADNTTREADESAPEQATGLDTAPESPARPETTDDAREPNREDSAQPDPGETASPNRDETVSPDQEETVSRDSDRTTSPDLDGAVDRDRDETTSLDGTTSRNEAPRNDPPRQDPDDRAERPETEAPVRRGGGLPSALRDGRG